MRAGAVVLAALALGACGQRVPGDPPVRHRGGIVSTNACADALLVELVPSARIAAISAASHDPAASALPPDIAYRFASVNGTAQEVIALKPKLVLASSRASPGERNAYAKAGRAVLYLDPPGSIDASKAQIREAAAALGENEAGRSLIAGIDRAIEAAAPRRGAARPSALFFTSGLSATGQGTLPDDLLQRAGFRNVAADYGVPEGGAVSAAALAARPPRFVFAAAGTDRAAVQRRHALAGKGMVTEVDLPPALLGCGGPAIGRALQRLAGARAQAQQ